MNIMDFKTNGRVDILGPIGPQFGFADKIHIKETTSFHDALTGTWVDTPLSVLFFSKENIKIIQNAIKKGVYDRSNNQFMIGEQSDDELKIIMRSIYLQNSENLPINITEQISTLNSLVLKYAIKQIYDAAVSYLKFRQDVSTMYTLPNHPVNSSNKGNTLELKPFV
tara:strand:- start:2130 stop:2630 length:501 start_codon:yes stop_codon:yes gene_type:complete